ncbi:MAG TPA: TetR/AcrR family transcriptional regulator [Solirubrobacterales bacterium]|nr:TetR/AcrR family transcriptional regulator [Solirubrobacterales bacterium]
MPRGPHRLPREYVVENQRSRLLAGAAMAMAERGYAKLTVENVITAAGVSRTTFYEHFESKHDCVRVAHDEAFDRLSGTIFRACAAESEWAAKLTAAVSAAIRFAIDNPDEARLLVFDAVGSDPELAARVLASNDHLVGLLRAGRDQCPQAASLPELTERAMIGAATSIVGSRIMIGQADRLPALEPQLVQLILIPYVGVEEAERIASAGL